jgi:hypothetical protein
MNYIPDTNPGTYWQKFEGKTWEQYTLYVEGVPKASFLHHEMGSLAIGNEVGKTIKMLIDRPLPFEEAVAAAEMYAGLNFNRNQDIPAPRQEN